MPDFAGTVVLSQGQWWIAWSFHGVYLVEGTLDQVKSWSQSKFGKSVQFPGTSVNINPLSPAGFGGASTAIIIGPFATKADAQKAAVTGNYPGVSGNESSVVPSGWVHNIEQWLLRGFEMLLGLGLIIVAVAKLAGSTPAGRTAAKAGKAAMIL